MKKKVYQCIAGAVIARLNCIQSNNMLWQAKHEQRIDALCADHLPSGSGFPCSVDGGTKIDLEASTADKLVFTTSYHHMNDSGMYDGETDHQVVVRPSLYFGMYIRITGADRNGFKDYAHEVFDSALNEEIEEHPQAGAEVQS